MEYGSVDVGVDRLEVYRWSVGTEPFTKGPHPQVILIQLLSPGQGAPRDQLVNVGVASVIANLFAFDAGPSG